VRSNALKSKFGNRFQRVSQHLAGRFNVRRRAGKCGVIFVQALSDCTKITPHFGV